VIIENLADKGIRRFIKPPLADIETIKEFHPEAICALGLLISFWGYSIVDLFITKLIPIWLISGYRENSIDSSVKNSPHEFGIAFDILISDDPWKQFEFIKLATETGLFFRGGVYIGRNTCHIDRCNDEWQRKYSGTKFWVWENSKYYGYANIGEVANHLLKAGFDYGKNISG
jgi:hypothetical protein